ncbi:hypothetical protein ACLVWQ_34510 [Streptomyces sp. CWNU-52B]|uniref:hypothetical protein n=1 Tax=unclassified Streptomyces TaxID=2593676 RepID=UPI0039C13381
MGRSWPVPFAVNMVLGIPGIVPAWLVYYFAANWPLAGLGLAGRNPTENDGVLPWLLLAGPVLTLFFLMWWLINLPIRRRTRLTPGTYWLLSAAAATLPTLALTTLVIIL